MSRERAGDIRRKCSVKDWDWFGRPGTEGRDSIHRSLDRASGAEIDEAESAFAASAYGAVRDLRDGVTARLRVELEVLACRAAREGQDEVAAKAFGAAAAVRRTLGAPRPLIDVREWEQSVTVVRTRMGARLYVAAWEEGYWMEPDQVLRASRTIPEKVDRRR
ncbi:MAG: hypothetical protein M3281_01930 [Chloroflexota bacterium]|nr:hypothetical protein [Chloroflexota bacterium]